MGGTVKWTVHLEAIDADGKTLGLSKLMAIALDLDRNDGVDFGLNLSDGKAIFEQFQAQIA